MTVPASALHMGKVTRVPSQHLDPETWCWLGPHFLPDLQGYRFPNGGNWSDIRGVIISQ